MFDQTALSGMKLTELKELFDGQLITQAEFDAQRGAIMKKHGMGG